MNRYNFGNITTNGVQTMAVSTFTGSNFEQQSRQRRLADASSALNNMTMDEVQELGRVRADRVRQEIRQSQNKTDGMTLLTDEEQQQYGERRAEDLRSYINRKKEEGEEREESTSVDDLVSGGVIPGTVEGIEVSTKFERDVGWLEGYKKAREELLTPTNEQLELLKRYSRGGNDTDANV